MAHASARHISLNLWKEDDGCLRGLANSKKPFLWVVRHDLVTKERGKMVSWCNQEKVLLHSAIGVFLTHSGWNSTLESLCGGVPMICWPFFAEQPTNCWYCCNKWGVGLEISGEVRREEVESMVRKLVQGDDEHGKAMRSKAREWKHKAASAAKEGGSSFESMKKLIRAISANPSASTTSA